MTSCIDSPFLNVSPSGDYLNKSNGIVFTISAPGKIILHGEHSVVHGKLALAASLGLRTSLTLRENESCDDINAIELHFPDINLHYSFNFKEIQNLLTKPLPSLSGTEFFNLEHPDQIDHELHQQNVEGFLLETGTYQDLTKVQKNALLTFLYIFIGVYGTLNIDIRPFHLSISSQLTLGAGTGSSASFVVCLTASLIHYAKLGIKRKSLNENISKMEYLQTTFLIESSLVGFSDDELRVISDWSFNGERIHHGNPSGVDNFVCTYGSLVAFVKGSKPEKKQILYSMKMMLINTKVSRNTKTLVSKVGEFVHNYPSIANHILEAMHEVSKTALNYIELLNDSTSRDDQKAIAFEKLGDLAEINHGLLSVLGVSHPSLENIISILKHYGLKGKLTGAGGGGYAICLIPSNFTDIKMDEVLLDIRNHGYDAKITVLGDEGVRVDA